MRYVAADILHDTGMAQPAPGWTWCVVDTEHPDELVRAVCEDEAHAQRIAAALNQDANPYDLPALLGRTERHRDRLEAALSEVLDLFADGSARAGNPYRHPEVTRALDLLGRDRMIANTTDTTTDQEDQA